MGTWAVACSPILKTTITVERLQQRGYESMLTYYLKIAPFLAVYPDYYRRTAVYVNRLVNAERSRSIQWCERRFLS